MSIFSYLQSKFVSLLLAILFLCTAVLGALLIASQRILAWLDGQHPHLNRLSLSVTSWLKRHPKMVSTSLASILLVGGGGAFAIAKLAPDIQDHPVVSITVPIKISALETQAQELDLFEVLLTRSDVTARADTPEKLLSRLGLTDSKAAQFLRTHPLARQALAQAGRTVTAEADNRQNLSTLNVRWLNNETDDFFQRLVVQRTEQGFEASLQTSPMQTSVRMTSGTVLQSLYDAADEARLPDPVVRQLTQIFSNQIDFHRTLRRGAQFSVVYEVLEADGEPIRTGRVLSAEINNDNQHFEAVWFESPDQKGNYFDMNGNSLSRSYLASPVPFSRKTSGFTMRLHPIFKTRQAHKGIDYAAPTGTPALVVGDGVVSFAGRNGGYGNVVEVNHGNGHKTLYAHLSKIHVRHGQKVQKGQPIGAVGSTGWSTGPHLHFEFLVNGRHVDPQKIIQQARDKSIEPSQTAQFKTLTLESRTQLLAAAQMRDSTSQ
jgi:murein DD-endopeptidase MepM/ murein hydrolase activator NlpD